VPCEYVCCECDIEVINVTADLPPEPPLCATCLHLPGWQSDPRLYAIFAWPNPQPAGSRRQRSVETWTTPQKPAPR
jgi:hypothetical protein